MLETALHYKSLGLSILGCRDKRPVMGSWLAFKTEIASDQDLTVMFRERKADQIACICGKVSGNLEIIDIDCKNDPRKAVLFDELWQAIIDYFDGTPPPFLITATPSGGFHIAYRCTAPIDGNQKLANLNDPKDPKKRLSIIETRGEGGYFIAAPSPGYSPLLGAIDALPVISLEVRNDLHDICRTFNQVLTVTRDKPKSKILYSFKETPWDAYNADEDHPALEVLKSHDWTVAREEDTQVFLKRPGSEHRWGAVYHTDTHILYVFSSSTVFENEKGYSPTAVLAILEYDGDFSAACSQLRRDGYGSIFTETEKRAMERASILTGEGLNYTDVMKMLSVEFAEVSEESLEKVIIVSEKKTRVRRGIFWTRNKAGNLRIVKPKLADFLSQHGYHLFGQSKADDEKVLVHIDNPSRIIREVPIDVMKKDIQAWMYDTDLSEFEITEDELRECLFNITSATWKDIFHWLHVLTVDTCNLLRDTKYTSYIAFRNGVVKINKADVTFISYDDLDPDILIWDTAIKDRDIALTAITHDLDLNNSSAYLFLKRIAGVHKDHDYLSLEQLAIAYNQEFSRLRSFITTTGYLLTNYKDVERPYAIVLAEDTPDQGKGGGTGKGMFVQMLSKVRNVCTLFGREWKPESEFAYQRVKQSTDILFIDDTPVRFDFQRLYNMLTEGINVNKKYRDEIHIPYSQSPKVVLATNYDVEAEGEHGKRRQIKLFFQKYFTASHKPKDEFGKLLFSDEWTEDEWNWYYNVMFFLIQSYYTWGITQVDTTDNMKVKQIKLKYREEFYEFVQEIISSSNGYDYNITKQYVPFDSLYQDFLNASSLTEKDYGRKRFSYGLQFVCDSFGWIFDSRRIWSGTVRGKKEIMIAKSKADIPEDEPLPF